LEKLAGIYGYLIFMMRKNDASGFKLGGLYFFNDRRQ
jgi:hypothetical protein